jgi:hypothetical protein
MIEEVLQSLRMNKTPTTPLHPQSDGMVESYLKTVKEYLRKDVASHHKNWKAILPIFFVAYTETRHYGLHPS